MSIPKRINNSRRSCEKCGKPGIYAQTIAALLLVFISGHAFTQTQPENEPQAPYLVKSSKGLQIKIYNDPSMEFIHAQLIIAYPTYPKNPAIPYLTMLNLFHRNLGVYTPQLLSMLEKMGNDYEVEHRPDFLYFKINFLPDKLPAFFKFLKVLYSYRAFLDQTTTSYKQRRRLTIAEDRFKDSIDNYWQYYYNRKDWKSHLARQVAYHHLFPGQRLGRTLVKPEMLKNLRLDHIRDFYINSYRLENSILALKGNIKKPPLVFGLIEHTFGSFKRKKHVKPAARRPQINTQRKIVVFHLDNNEPPVLFWYEAVPLENTEDLFQPLILNNILFDVPIGRVFANRRPAKLGPFKVKTSLFNHYGVSVIINTTRLRYVDIEKFILLAARERQKLTGRRVSREEYVSAWSSIYSQLKVRTRDYRTEVNNGILDLEYSTKEAKLISFNQKIDKTGSEMIVIVGNSALITPNLGSLKYEVIDFKLR